MPFTCLWWGYHGACFETVRSIFFTKLFVGGGFGWVWLKSKRFLVSKGSGTPAHINMLKASSFGQWTWMRFEDKKANPKLGIQHPANEVDDINQSINQSINKSAIHSTKQTKQINQSQVTQTEKQTNKQTNKPTNQPTSQSASQPTNQPASQPTTKHQPRRPGLVVGAHHPEGFCFHTSLPRFVVGLPEVAL